MKIAARDAAAACARPAAEWVGVLLYGPDQGLVAERRRQLVSAVLGPDAADLQVTQVPATQARKSPADIEAALTTRGFFAGRQIVVIEGATDGVATVLDPVLRAVLPDDGLLVLTADQLPARSRLRKMFEGSASLASIGIYPRPMTGREIEDHLSRCSHPGLSSDAASLMAELAGNMDFGAFRQFLDTVELFGLDRSAPLSAAEVTRLSPLGLDGDTDEFVMLIADGATPAVGSRLRRLEAGGAGAVGIVLALQRHFRALLTASTSDAGLAALRPQPQGPRRDRVQRQLRAWNADRLEQANRLLFDLDRRLRSSTPPPDFASLERTALRLAMLASR